LEGAVRRNIESLVVDLSALKDGKTPDADGKQPVSSAPMTPAEAGLPAETSTGLIVTKWEYDQQAQKAAFEFKVKDDAADMFTLRSWALQQIRNVCTEEYTLANPGAKAGVLGFSLVSSLNRPEFRVDVAVYRIRPVNHLYDSATRTGTLTVDIGRQGQANYAETYKWALDNIGVICSSKEISMEAGQPPPEGARYMILSERTNRDGMLEITFKVVQ
jgi:hypothetical protein